MLKGLDLRYNWAKTYFLLSQLPILFYVFILVEHTECIKNPFQLQIQDGKFIYKIIQSDLPSRPWYTGSELSNVSTICKRQEENNIADKRQDRVLYTVRDLAFYCVSQ